MAWSQTINEALSIVANMAQREKSRWQIGQPLWLADDHRCFIVWHLTRNCSGQWIVDAVLETDPTGQIYYAHENCFSDHPPATEQLHSAQRGIIYLTATGRPIKLIRNQHDGGNA